MISVEVDHYAVLGLKPGSSMEEVKKQYRHLAKLCHPDLHNNNAWSQERLRCINAAYGFLSDASRKAAYDARFHRAPVPSIVIPPPSPRPAPLRPTPPLDQASPPSFVTTPRNSVPVTATRHPLKTLADLRLTRSAWLGATAVLILLLIVVGIALESGDHGGGRMSSVALDDGVGSGSTSPMTASYRPPPSSGVSSAQTPSLPISSDDALILSSDRALTGGGGHTNSVEALKQPLLVRYHALLPRIDRLIHQGYAAQVVAKRKAHALARQGYWSRDTQLDQLSSDLVRLSETRDRVEPAIHRLSLGDTSEKLERKTTPILGDLQNLEDSWQPVQEDLRALASASPLRIPSATLHFPIPVRSAYRASKFIPKRAISEPVEPPVTPSPKRASSVSSGQEFILWGK